MLRSIQSSCRVEHWAPRSLQINELLNMPDTFPPEIYPTCLLAIARWGCFQGIRLGQRRQTLPGFFIPAFLECGRAVGGFPPAPEAQLTELSQIIVHPDRALAAIDQSRNPLLHCITISRKNMFSEICVIWG